MADPPPPLPLLPLAPDPADGSWPPPALAQQVGRLDPEQRPRVAAYLRNSPVFLAWMEYTRDVLEDRFGIEGGSAIASDGVYYWRLDAAGYVEEYGLGIPDEAVEHMRLQGWRPPTFTQEHYRRIYLWLMDLPTSFG